jgi:hypothetical protein
MSMNFSLLVWLDSSPCIWEVYQRSAWKIWKIN